MAHFFPITVYYEDTDMGGIVYHANYLKYIERARSAWVREKGIDQVTMRRDGSVFAVRRVEGDFLAPSRLDDALEVETAIESASGARMVLCQVIRRGPRTLFRARVELVVIDHVTGGVRRMPPELRALG
ncbi:tol-pal system-associated acyl-CoA thioesterase [Palleronia rufa]|uniref:tol-pal system-associated acyl-CoA thioesterase n=1 Tax=Palleronia rufa TaxID=1530186 RepID=UPI00055E607E|nr:tol-pal system-associated acyl-CoA thioesterase [Palleronia rufa]